MGKKMSKKTLMAIISACLAVALLSTSVIVALSTNNGKIFGTIAKYSDKVQFTATLASTNLSLSTTTTVDTTWSELGWGTDEGEGTVASPNCAKFALLMCLDAQDICRVNLEGETNTDDTDNLSFPKSLGFDGTDDLMITANKVICVNDSSKSYTIEGKSETDNADDTTRMVVSYGDYPGGCVSDQCYFVNVSFGGTTKADVGEWRSNFDLGSTNQDLYKGSTTDWTDKDNHKGFDVAATRALDALMKYMKELPNADGDVFFYVMLNGYSRGAAIANIIGARFEEEFIKEFGKNKLVYSCYTFATPTTTTDAAAGNVPHVFNFVSVDDLMTNMPPATVGFRRYGKDYSFTLTGDENSELRTRFAEISKQTYNNFGIFGLVNGISSICSGRDDYYNPDSSDASITKTYTFDALEEAQAKKTSLEMYYGAVCPVNQSMFYKVTLDESANKVTLSVAPAFVGQVLPFGLDSDMAAASHVNVTDYVTELASFSRYLSMAMSMNIASWNPMGIQNMHFPYQYLIYVDVLTTSATTEPAVTTEPATTTTAE